MNILKEAAVAIGDHVTAPVRKISYEIRIGCKADIERVHMKGSFHEVTLNGLLYRRMQLARNGPL